MPTEFDNPKPVVVLIVPTTRGVLLVRRGLEDAYGKIALPGGYQITGETWQAAGCRETEEETGVVLDPKLVRLFHVETVGADLGINLIYGIYDETVEAPEIGFTGSETLAILFAEEPTELAFPSHTEQLRRYYTETPA
jgi:ADP-ribose pyrophosphatase YjhB (NUDIX family)